MISRRPRRNRSSDAIRSMIRETELNTSHLVLPLFTLEGKNIKSEVASLPGTYRMSPDNILKEIEDCLKYDLNKFIIFPAVQEKYKDRLKVKGATEYSIKNDKNNLTILLDQNNVILKSSEKIDLSDNELNEFLCSYKKTVEEELLKISICEDTREYDY